MPTLIQINTVVNYGSTGRMCEEIGELVIRRGWRSIICYGRNKGQSKSETIKIGNEWDIIWHGIQTRLLDRHGLASKKATIKLVEKIKEIRPDIIHLHNLHGYYLNISVLFDYLAKADIPVIWTFHDCWPLTGHCCHFTYVDCHAWQNQCKQCPQKKQYPASYLIDRSSKNYILKKRLFTSIRKMNVIPVSNWLAGILKVSFFNKYPIKTIYNGVNTKSFSPRPIDNLRKKYDISSRKFIILGVANVWSERKGLKDYFKLSKLLNEDEEILLVGVTEKILKRLPPKIIGIKRIDNLAEVAELYSMADVVCNLSYEETFGKTTVEGLACGTPAVVYNSTASPELISPGIGFVVDPGDISGIRKAIDVIKEKGRSFYSTKCRERALRMFDKDKQWAEYIDLYERLIQHYQG